MMKLSEVLKKDWPEKKEMVNLLTTREVQDPYYYGKDIGFNTALTSCDREIDREALAKERFKRDKKVLTWDEAPTLHEEYFREADAIISTMPTWLRKG